MALLIMLSLYLVLVQMTSEEEVEVWAWTEDYDLIVVEGDDFEPIYGIQNRHTGVVEVQEPVFSNAVNYLMEIQEAYESAAAIIAEDGSLMTDNLIKVSFKPKTEWEH